MLSPMMTVVVLAVLWLIVVVPMVAAPQRRTAARPLGRRVRPGDARARPTLPHPSDTQVFVPTPRRRTGDPLGLADPQLPTRRPVPAAQEALMYPVDRTEMSAARQQMMARRRRSLTILIAGTIVFLPLALFLGGIDVAARPRLHRRASRGYFWFLRSQAMKDRERRLHRQQRAAQRRTREVDATADQGYFAAVPDSAVRIDDDDIEFQNMDTIDLTGLYSEEAARSPRPSAGALPDRRCYPDRRPRSVGGPPDLGAVAQSGSAPRSQRGGQGFESPQLHQCPSVSGASCLSGLPKII